MVQVENNDTPKEHVFIPTGSTINVQRGDIEPWTHGMIT